MKKFIVFALCIVMGMASFATLTGCTPRENILKIYNWGEYMDEDVTKDFENWYFEQTGEKVKVQYKEFSTNEDMYSEISKTQADYDLICPSDYMIDKMIKENLLVEVDKEIVYGGADAASIVNPDLLDIIATYDEGNKYSVPYMWGTLGIMYDKTKISENAVMDSWEVLFGDTYSGKMYMKNSERDAFAAANIYANLDALSLLSNNFTDFSSTACQTLLDTLMSDPAAISSVETTLKAQKSKVFAYENDEGKDALASKSNDVVLGLFWSCDAGYAMSESQDLFYYVPKEGSNVWMDSFCISRYSENQQAAQYFLKYLVQTDIAVRNLDYIGSSSPITAAAEEYLESLNEDEEFLAYDEDFRNMYISMMFPSDEVLERCSVMRDFGDKTAELKEMWSRVKAS